MPKMRTIDQAAAFVQEQDVNTSLTKTAIRRLVTTGKIPSVRIGTKYLVDLDVLTNYLVTGTPTQEPVTALGNIRRIGVQ
jgi:excisionase family DNA binding protein